MDVPRFQQPNNFSELQAAIERQCRALPQAMIRDAFDAKVSRFRNWTNVGEHTSADERTASLRNKFYI